MSKSHGNKNRLISILSWDVYQGSDKQNDKQVINKMINKMINKPEPETIATVSVEETDKANLINKMRNNLITNNNNIDIINSNYVYKGNDEKMCEIDVDAIISKYNQLKSRR